MNLYERNYPTLLIYSLEIRLDFVFNLYMMRQAVLIIMELTMKIHTLLLCHDNDKRKAGAQLDLWYLCTLRDKQEDYDVTKDYRTFHNRAKEIIDKDPSKRYFITGEYTKKSHIHKDYEKGEVYYCKTSKRSEIGWKKLMQVAKKSFGSDYEITHNKFQDKVYITKKIQN